MTTREELIRACRKAEDYLATVARGDTPRWPRAVANQIAMQCRLALARAEAEDAANAPAAATDGEALFANELGGES